jgi:hypothetical protein
MFPESSPSTTTTSALGQRIQYYLDRSVPYPLQRWMIFAAMLVLYAIRVILLEGFYIVTYALGIFLLHLLVGFLSPQEDPEDGPVLPTSGDDEFRPFQRRLPEYKFWLAASKAVGIAMICTIFPFLDIPVFWPILLVYFIALFLATMKKQIKHMIRHKYVPFDFGKKQYKSKRTRPQQQNAANNAPSANLLRKLSK